MEVLFTPSARRQLLELVASARARDRGHAERLLDALGRRCGELAADADSGRPVDGASGIAADGELRLYTWVRAGVLWVVACLK